jgi:hypothetical protein
LGKQTSGEALDQQAGSLHEPDCSKEEAFWPAYSIRRSNRAGGLVRLDSERGNSCPMSVGFHRRLLGGMADKSPLPGHVRTWWTTDCQAVAFRGLGLILNECSNCGPSGPATTFASCNRIPASTTPQPRAASSDYAGQGERRIRSSRFRVMIWARGSGPRGVV